ncbi:MAG: DASS family sodium-coupled anion symporter [candidate division WOR-3 bacterium]|nr:DASS family sodium-coupled anion symporter [candidate division WOR-3 bacterium]
MKKWLSIGIAILFAVLVYLAPFEGLTEPARRTFAILIIAAVLWISEAIPLYVTSFVIAFLEVVLLKNVLNVSYKVYLYPFFDPIIALFLGGFVLSRALDKYGIDERITRAILLRTGNSPRKILFGTMIVSAFLSMWMSNTATAALMMTIAITIINALPEKDPFKIGLILGIPFACNIGGMATPIGTPPNAIAISSLASLGISISFINWMLIALPIVIVILLLTWWLLSSIYKSKVKNITLSMGKLPPMEINDKWVLSIFIITVTLWLTGQIHGIPTGVVALIPPIVLIGGGFIDRDDFRSLGWDILILMGGGLSLGVAMQQSGLAEWMVERLNVGGLASPILLMLIFSSITVVMTTFISNTSTAALVLPIAITIGAAPSALALITAFSASIAMILPISTPPNAIAYGSGLVSVKDMAKTGFAVTFISIFIVTGMSVLLTRLLGYL